MADFIKSFKKLLIRPLRAAKKYPSLIPFLVISILSIYLGLLVISSDFGTYLGTIGQSLATILAIVFALILIPIQHFADKYTVETLKEFKKNIVVRALFIFISIVTLLTIFLLGFYKDLPDYLVAIVFFLTSLCFYFLYLLYFYIVDLLDPRKIVNKKTGKIGKMINDGNGENETKNSHLKNTSIIKELDIPEQIVLKSIENDELDVAKDAIYSITKLAYLITGKKRNSLNSQILDRILSFYFRTLLHALKHDSNTKYSLIYVVRDLILIRPEESPFNKEYLPDLMKYLYNANKLIIDRNDTSLFKAQLDYFSSYVEKDKQIEKEILDTFFMVGSYTLCSENREHYIKAIWTNIPRDTGINILNKDVVSFDIEFLTEQVLRLSELDRYISEMFSNLRPCIIKYYLLCLTRALHTMQKDWQITIPTSNDRKKELVVMLNQLKGIMTEVLSKCDELENEAEKWSDLIKPKEKRLEETSSPSIGEPEVTTSETVRIETKDAFKNTKKWLEEKNSKIDEVENILLQSLPLDEKKIRDCKEDILKHYAQGSIVSRVVHSRVYHDASDREKEFLQLGQKVLIDRFWFTNPTAVTFFSQFGKNVAIGEEKYLIDQLQKDRAVNIVEQISYNCIKSSVELFVREGFAPSSIFVPIDYFVQMHQWIITIGDNDVPALQFESGRTYLTIDENMKLEIFWSSKYVVFSNIIIVDKSFGEWIVKPTDSREMLTVEIKDYEKDNTKVVITVKTDFRFEIVNGQAVKIIGLS